MDVYMVTIWMCSVFRKGTLRDKKIIHLNVISILTKCEQSVQTTYLTIKVETKALHLSCGFWPGKIIFGRNTYYSSPGKAGLMGIAVLMAAQRVPHQTSCPAAHTTSRVQCLCIPYVQVCSTSDPSFSPLLQSCFLMCIHLFLQKVTDVTQNRSNTLAQQ